MTEVEFRNGPRLVPDHVAALMDHLETFKLTYEEAMQLSNGALLRDHVNGIQTKIVAKHFKEGETWHR